MARLDCVTEGLILKELNDFFDGKDPLAHLRPKDSRVYLVAPLVVGVIKHGFDAESKEKLKEFPKLIELLEYAANESSLKGLKNLHYSLGPDATVENLAEAALASFKEIKAGKTTPLDFGDLNWKEPPKSKQPYMDVKEYIASLDEDIYNSEYINDR